MGFFSSLGKSIINGIGDFNQNVQKYYSEGQMMSDERLMSELREARRSDSKAKMCGYRKAAKERGLIN